jgi:dATP/dGTP diphosphohydrolase
MTQAKKGLRYNEGKVRWSLVPVEVLTALANHFTVGAKKYEDDNWRRGLKYSDTYDCAKRHLEAWFLGESHDAETGTHHLISCMWNIVALAYFEMYPERYGKFDDRWKPGPFGDIIPPCEFSMGEDIPVIEERVSKMNVNEIKQALTDMRNDPGIQPPNWQCSLCKMTTTHSLTCPIRLGRRGSIGREIDPRLTERRKIERRDWAYRVFQNETHRRTNEK